MKDEGGRMKDEGRRQKAEGGKGFKEVLLGNEVVSIPEEWEVRKLNALGTGKRPTVKAGPFGSSLKKEFYVPKGYKVYGQEQVISNDWKKGNYYIDEVKFKELESCEVLPGDLLISLVGTIGKILLLPENIERGIINPRLIRISIDQKIIFPEYLKYYFNLPRTINSLHRNQHGGTMGVLNAGIIKNLNFLLPPMAEQKKIAAILSGVDETIRATREVIEQTKRVKQGLLQELLTKGIRHKAEGKKRGFKEVRLGNEVVTIPEEWEVKKLGAVLEESKERNLGKLEDTEIHAVFKNLGLIPMRDRVKGQSFERCKIVNPNSFAYNPMRINIGSIAMNTLDKTIMVSPDYIVFKMNEKLLNHFYFNYIRQSSLWNNYIKVDGSGSVRIRIYFKDLARFPFPLPPLDEQKQIAAILSNVDDSIRQNEEKLAQLKQLKKGLMQDLLTGKKRVKE